MVMALGGAAGERERQLSDEPRKDEIEDVPEVEGHLHPPIIPQDEALSPVENPAKGEGETLRYQ